MHHGSLRYQTIALLAAVLCYFSACDQPEFEVAQGQKILMDTFVSVRVFLQGGQDKAPAEAAIADAWHEMARLDTMLSSYRDDNEMARVNRAAHAGPAALSQEMLAILKRSLELSGQTAGAFDVTVGELTHLWGFGRKPAMPASEQIAQALSGVGFRFLQLDTIGSTIQFSRENTELDLGGIAKGAIIDAAFGILKDAGFDDFLIDAGGDLRMSASTLTAGKRNVWVTHPRKQGEFFARFELDNGAVATTGDYERFFYEEGKKYHHIIDPATGFPSHQAVSTTVIANDAMTADALATAFFILGPQKAIAIAEQLAGVEAMVVFENGQHLEALATKNLAPKIQFLDTDAKDKNSDTEN